MGRKNMRRDMMKMNEIEEGGEYDATEENISDNAVQMRDNKHNKSINIFKEEEVLGFEIVAPLKNYIDKEKHIDSPQGLLGDEIPIMGLVFIIFWAIFCVCFPIFLACFLAFW